MFILQLSYSVVVEPGGGHARLLSMWERNHISTLQCFTIMRANGSMGKTVNAAGDLSLFLQSF